jgi:hypothetical protein
MATSSSEFGLRIPATYPENQTFPAAQGTIYTDTETRPSTSTALRSREAYRKPYSAENRNVQVQTKVFRTDQDNGAVDFQSTYTTVNKELL